MYPLSPKELLELDKYLDKALKNQWISPSKSQVAAPCFFVKKPNDGLRLCIDFREINAISQKNHYPLPLISSLLDRLGRAKIFTRLDFPDAYHLIRIKAGDEWKTAFRCARGTFEYNVIPFGLCNAPAAFQNFMNDILQEFLDIFVVVYLDDILIF